MLCSLVKQLMNGPHSLGSVADIMSSHSGNLDLIPITPMWVIGGVTKGIWIPQKLFRYSRKVPHFQVVVSESLDGNA